jgi:dolichol-phosphate mannosyltransferase
VRTLVVLPTYQEAENIAEVLGRIRAAAPDASILVVDDGSPDGTADLAQAVGREIGQVSVLRQGAKGGLGPAYRAGFRRGLAEGFEILIEIDADLSHDPADLPRLIGEVEGGADLAIGSRYVPGGATPDWPSRRRWLSIAGNRYAGALLALPVRDATAGYRAYRSEVVRRIDLDRIRADGYGFQIEMAYAIHRLGGRIVEVPITFRDRVLGTSKMSGRIVVEAIGLVTWWGLRDRVRPRRQGDRPIPSKV